MRKPEAIIGMSPGNSYFKDYEVKFLLQEAISRFGRCTIMVADVPAIQTYIALGYAANKARNKAIPKGNNLKNRTRRLREELGFEEDQVRIIDWAEEVENDPEYQKHYDDIELKYKNNYEFADDVRATSRSVLEGTGKVSGDIEVATENATHYLLSELAFMEYAPKFLDVERVCYLYHRNWPIYENYIRGQYDDKSRPNLDFLLLEAPYETYTRLNSQEVEESQVMHDTYSRVTQSGVLRTAFVEYPPIMHQTGEGYSGVFYDIISGFAEKHGLALDWVEETGYGAVIEGLQEGRFDVFCSATWPTPERQRHAALSVPVYYSDVGVWVREDSPLAGQDWLVLNDFRYQIAITENDITHSICLTDFTQAKWVRAPQLGRVRALLEMVADKRATATMVEQLTYEAYAEDLSHPLVNIARDKPIRRYQNCFLMGKDQNDFKDMLDEYLSGLIEKGEISALFKKNRVNMSGISLPSKGQ